jgi:hypothetical protein
MITADGAGASHALIARLDKLAARPGYQLIYSVGWELGERERAAIGTVPAQGWQAAIDARGEIRERRAGQACGTLDCGHRRCWIEEAHVTELTGLLRAGPHGDQLAAWPEAMRVFARRERPHPGAQLTLFEAEDGWRYSLWVTNLPPPTRGWRGQLAYIDAVHRVHARVEDAIRTGKGLRHRQVPVHRAGDEQGLAGRRPDRRGPAGLAPAARPGRPPGPGRAEDPALPHPARRRPAGPRRPPAPPQDRRQLALGR